VGGGGPRAGGGGVTNLGDMLRAEGEGAGHEADEMIHLSVDAPARGGVPWGVSGGVPWGVGGGVPWGVGGGVPWGVGGGVP